MTRGSVDYQKGCIYAIYSQLDPTQFYIGSTTNINQRWREHKSRCFRMYKWKLYEKMAEDGFDNFYIELYEKYPCNDKKELEKREGQIQRQLNPPLNSRIAGRTNEEYIIENKDKILERQKEFRENNKQKIQKRQSTKVKCECGNFYTLSHKARHLQTQQHLNLIKNNDRNNQ